MSQLTVRVAVASREDLWIVIPAEAVISTTLVVADTNSSLPTLTSVEAIVGRLGALGISVAEPGVLDRFAKLVNTHYLAVAPDNWANTTIGITGEIPSTRFDTESFRVVQGIRPPIMNAANSILRTGVQSGSPHRREQEARFLDVLTKTVRQERSVWETWPGRVALFLGKTVLSQLVTALIGVPLPDIAGHVLG